LITKTCCPAGILFIKVPPLAETPDWVFVLMMTTPVPMKPKDGVSVIPQTKPGVTVHKIVTTTDITLPGTSTNTQSGVSASGGTLMNVKGQTKIT
jgi:hypothetical protein